jgi:hypothetical protein
LKKLDEEFRRSRNEQRKGAPDRRQAMLSDSVTGPYAWVVRALCVVVLAIIVAAVLYAAWIGITNYSRIAV